MADRRARRRAGLAIAGALAVAPLAAARAQATSPVAAASRDSARTVPAARAPLLERRHWYALSGLAVATAATLPFDERVTLALRDRSRQESRGWRTAMQVADAYGTPIAYAAGPLLLASGSLLGHEPTFDVGGHVTEAYVVATVAVITMKGIAGRNRPYWPGHSSPSDFKLGRGFPRKERYSSFPSGHSTGAFVFASAMTAEAAHWMPERARLVGIVLYGGAIADGVSRVYRDTHWPSDVVAGALVGTAAGWLVTRRAHAARPGEARGSAGTTAAGRGTGRGIVGTPVVQPTGDGAWRVGWSATF